MSGEEELQSNVSVASSSPTSNCCASGGLKEHNYLGLSDSSSSSVGSSTLSGLDDKAAISLKATELTLDEVSLKNGNKRAFSDAMDKSESSMEATQNIPKGQGSATTNSSSPPAAKAQIVGWPPVRSYRKNTLATTCKNSDEVDGKPGSAAALFVKVSMDGAPYLRKLT
ncbi:hypothetical protein F2Q70_00019061 [Brassica cretica]|uniref:Auxin-responsive protein n=1 Tax=Brassica cretica TaxID=69181 RepID=A0A8S9I3D9_BRACR|nr:hypothetical protein F2Q70_00019061 [Brassica cretica]